MIGWPISPAMNFLIRQQRLGGSVKITRPATDRSVILRAAFCSKNPTYSRKFLAIHANSWFGGCGTRWGKKVNSRNSSEKNVGYFVFWLLFLDVFAFFKII